MAGLALTGLAVFYFPRYKNLAAGHKPVSQNTPPAAYQSSLMQQDPKAHYDPKYFAEMDTQPYTSPD